MNKLRASRFKAVAVDMTAMCDVAFLILCFFVLSAKYRPWEPVKINLPLYSNHIADPDGNTAFILIADDKALFEIADEKVRARALALMSAKYHVSFSAAEQAKFNNTPIIGAPLSGLKYYIANYYDSPSSPGKLGIPYYSGSNNELADWVRSARIAKKEIYGTDLQITIKSDKGEEYPVIKQVIAILQSQKVNKFSLLTTPKRVGI